MPEQHTVERNSGRLWLSAWEKRGLVLLLLALIGFGVVVEIRSALLKRRMGDFSVFARTAWAVRTGEDIYSVTDENHFHYHYPALFAILLTPLADPPPGADHTGYLPYAVSVGIWYVFSLLCLALAVHVLASALEESSPDPEVRDQPRGCRRWWLMRVLPVLVCLPPIGHTLMRGQVGLLLLLLLCGLAAATLRGRRFQAGLWLAGAICLKIIPAFLLLFPLVRRDLRTLVGCSAGLFVGLVVAPLTVFGPERTLAYYEEWGNDLIRPGLHAGGNGDARAKELLNVTATDSQSFVAVIHNSLYPDPWTRPDTASAAVRHLHWLIGGCLTLVTLFVARQRNNEGPRQVLFLGTLVLVMLLLSPVCHLHYFCLSVILVMGVLAAEWQGQCIPVLSWGTTAVLTANVIANALPQFPVFQRLRDDGLATAGALLLWTTAVVLLRKQAGAARVAAPATDAPRMAA